MRRCSGGSSSKETESTTTRPEGFRNPAILSINDVFPEPDGPTSAVTLASLAQRTSSVKGTSGNRTSISINAMRASAATTLDKEVEHETCESYRSGCSTDGFAGRRGRNPH